MSDEKSNLYTGLTRSHVAVHISGVTDQDPGRSPIMVTPNQRLVIENIPEGEEDGVFRINVYRVSGD